MDPRPILGHARFDVAPRRVNALPSDARLAAPEVARKPGDEVRMEVRVADGIEEEWVLDSVECLRNINGHCSSSERWFGSVETVGHSREGWKKSSGCGVRRTKTMLRGGRRKSRREKRKNASLQELRSGTKERDWAIGGGDKGGFVMFRDSDDEGLFPDRGKVSVKNKEVKEGGEVGDGTTAKVFQMDHGNAIRPSGR